MPAIYIDPYYTHCGVNGIKPTNNQINKLLWIPPSRGSLIQKLIRVLAKHSLSLGLTFKSVDPSVLKDHPSIHPKLTSSEFTINIHIKKVSVFQLKKIKQSNYQHKETLYIPVKCTMQQGVEWQHWQMNLREGHGQQVRELALSEPLYAVVEQSTRLTKPRTSVILMVRFGMRRCIHIIVCGGL